MQQLILSSCTVAGLHVHCCAVQQIDVMLVKSIRSHGFDHVFLCMQGDPTLSLSCSDKLAKWCCMGLQGCLLSGLLQQPIYLSSLVVGMPPNVSGELNRFLLRY